MGDQYSDPWQEYRAILGRTKRKFLKKPNLTQAATDFTTLAQRLEDEECLPYAALCHQSASKAYKQAGNSLSHLHHLQTAARFFARAEEEKKKLGLPGLHDNLISSLDCYNQSIKSLIDNKQKHIAGTLCVEVAMKLKQSERVDESIEYLERALVLLDDEPSSKEFILELNKNVERALLLLDDEPSSKEFILEMLIACRVELTQFHSALNNVDELWTMMLKLNGDTRVGNASRVLKDCEMITIMLLLVVQTLPHQMNGRQTHLMDMYRRITCPLTPLPKETALDDEDFLCLQSFLLSIQERDVNGADRALDKLSEKAIDPVLELGLILVERIATDGDEP